MKPRAVEPESGPREPTLALELGFMILAHVNGGGQSFDDGEFVDPAADLGAAMEHRLD